MREINNKIQALEIDYENICIENKVDIMFCVCMKWRRKECASIGEVKPVQGRNSLFPGRESEGRWTWRIAFITLLISYLKIKSPFLEPLGPLGDSDIRFYTALSQTLTEAARS